MNGKAPAWLTKESVAEFAQLKMQHPEGDGDLDVFTAMAVAAHKQWEDIDNLLPLLEEHVDQLLLNKIRARHELYREAKKGRPDVVFP
jgi:hypothetical protein